MTSTTKLPDPVQWSEGMLLSPQHLQQNDMVWQAHLNHKLACAAPNARGVSRLAINPEMLAKGIVQVTAVECLLDDGHAVVYPGNYQDLVLERDVAELCRKEAGPVRIWLALPRRGIDAVGMADADKRYELLPGVLTSDENLDNGYQVSVVRMRALIRLIAGRTVPPQYAACPLAEVIQDAQGRFRLTAYHPPMLQAGASLFQNLPGLRQGLQSRLEDLCTGLWAKLRELAGNRSDEAPDDYAALGSESQYHLMVARQLAACLPQFDIAVTAGSSHPETLYRSLAQVVGAVASIGADPVPLKMEAYAHDDCMPQFQRAIDYIEGKLKLINTAYDFMEFARIGEGGFARRLPVETGDEVLVELKARDGQSLTEMKRWLNDARIAGAELMPELQKRRLSGAAVRPLSVQEILHRNLRPNAALFAIRNDVIEIEGKGRLPMFVPGQSLLIQGSATSSMPAAVILYRYKTPQAEPLPSPVTAAKPLADEVEEMDAVDV